MSINSDRGTFHTLGPGMRTDEAYGIVYTVDPFSLDGGSQWFADVIVAGDEVAKTGPWPTAYKALEVGESIARDTTRDRAGVARGESEPPQFT